MVLNFSFFKINMRFFNLEFIINLKIFCIIGFPNQNEILCNQNEILGNQSEILCNKNEIFLQSK